MPRAAVENTVPRGDRALLRAFPRVAQRLETNLDEWDRAEQEAYLKLLPGALERFQASTLTHTDSLPESISNAINDLTKSFGARNATSVNTVNEIDPRNTSVQFSEDVSGVSTLEESEDSVLSSSAASLQVPHTQQVSAAGSGDSTGKDAKGMANARVATRSRLQGKGRRAAAPHSEARTASNQG